MNLNDRRIPLPGDRVQAHVTSSGDSALHNGRDSFSDWSIRTLVTTPGTIPFLPGYGSGAELAAGGSVPVEGALLQNRHREALENDDRVARADVTVVEDAGTDDESASDARKRRVRLAVTTAVEFVTGEQSTFTRLL